MTAVALPIAADHPAFDGHFPGAPVLPGVVLLDEAIRAIELADGGEPRRWRVASVKFLRPVAPGEALMLEQERLAGGTIRISILGAGRAVATGALAPGEPVSFSEDVAQP
jgi:3-hydroxyacyl-[acyl-carrier-protein] dehydratase